MKSLVLGLAAVGGALYLFMGKAFAGTGKLGMPAHSEPDAPALRALNPVKTDATAASGRKYEVWMYPPQAGLGIYTVAKEKDGKAWIAFFSLDGTRNIPVKTNATELGLTVEQALSKTQQLKTDWSMP